MSNLIINNLTDLTDAELTTINANQDRLQQIIDRLKHSRRDNLEIALFLTDVKEEHGEHSSLVQRNPGLFVPEREWMGRP